MDASLETHTFFPDRLNNAIADLARRLDLTDSIVEELELRDLIRTTYCAASNARAIAMNTAFAYRILQAACTAAQVELIRRLSATDGLLKVAIRLHLEGKDMITEVIEDLLTE
jgi:hypothetical protein